MSAKKKTSSEPILFRSDNGASRGRSRRRQSLVLPTYLAEEARQAVFSTLEVQAAHNVLLKWADLDAQGYLTEKKETSLDADFLLEVFGRALGYKLQTDSPEEWNLARMFSVSGAGTADGALGDFVPGLDVSPIAVIELKDADVDLDRDRFNGRTAVQQCWDYLNALPDCPWGIVSNFITIRLYHRNLTPSAYEEFTLQDLRGTQRFREFYCLFEIGGLLRGVLKEPPRALKLLRRTGERQREVGDELYNKYSDNRLWLIRHLHREKGKSLEAAIHIAQRLIDRIVFIAFCEDRGLLRPRTIEQTHHAVPPLARATNPRWRNFLDLFHAMDKGHRNLDLPTGYDGGLFKQDDEVDNLQLDDEWTSFFVEVGGYDFRDEVNVDVLGHLFEKSVTDLEKLRLGGLFEPGEDQDRGEDRSKMPKSAKRKRMGIYYTPPEFTSFLVRNTVEEVIAERFAAIAKEQKVDPKSDATGKDGAKLAEYWRACLAALRDVKVCDPACGSGAFLIQAYTVLEQEYETVAAGLAAHDRAEADRLEEQIPDMILADNLHGVDLSPEAVEITQLALWIRSARRGKTLADLSKNIIAGNSLVADKTVDRVAVDWAATFPAVFSREDSGFDCVIGNPPWERLKVQEREFFSFSASEIAEAVSAAKRRQLIAELQERNVELFQRYVAAIAAADRALAYARGSGQFPLTGKGDINTYMLFAELARNLVRPRGRAGLLVPSGIATDETTKEFFGELVSSKALIKLFDFENKAPIFPDVHRSFKFSAIVFGGSKVRCRSAGFVFFAHTMGDVADKKRHIALTAEDIALLNPNTRTCPVFRSNRDAELTKAIYRRVPVLLERSRSEAGNPWGVRFVRMFDQTNDAELFHTAEELAKKGLKQRGNRWAKGKETYLPLYEAKMIQAYDHRAASVVVDEENWMRQGQTAETSLLAHQNPDFVALPRWWVDASAVEERLGSGNRAAYLCYKDVTSPTNERTMIAAFIPHTAVVNSAPLVITDESLCYRGAACLLANLNSFVLDYVARQKVGGIHLNFFVVEQLPIVPPEEYERKCAWNQRVTLERWVSDRALKLTCTAEDMRPLAEACELKEPTHRWHAEERAQLMAELDAAYFHLYGIKRDDVEYILSTFTGTRRRDEAEIGRFRTAELILAAYDELGG